MKQLVVYCSYTEQTENLATKVMNELKNATCSTTLIVANMYTESSIEPNTLPWQEASIRLYFVSRTALENVCMQNEIQMILNGDDKNSNVFFLASSSLGRMSNKDAVRFYVSKSFYDASMFFVRYRLYTFIYEKLYGQPKHHSYLTDPADQYFHAMWILACHFDNFDDLILARNLLEKSAKASNMLALNYVGYSLCCGAVPFDVEEERGIEMMMKAADLGHPIGMINVGKYLWQQGEYKKAISLLQKGLCDVEDDGGGYSLLSQCYAEGFGVSKNPDKALRYKMLSKALHTKYCLKDSMRINQIWRNMALNSEIRF